MAAPRVTTEISGKMTAFDGGNFNSSKSYVPSPAQPDIYTTMHPSHYGLLQGVDKVKHVVRHEKDADPAVMYRTYTDKAVLKRDGQEVSFYDTTTKKTLKDEQPGLRGVRIL